MSGPRFPWRGGGGGMNSNPWAMGRFSAPPPGPRPPMMHGQGPNNWRSPNGRPIIRYDMGPFEVAPRGMRPGFYPNSPPHMMNMSGCRPPNPERFKPSHLQLRAQDQDDNQEMKSHGQSNQTQNCGGNMASGPSNNFRGKFQNGENFNGKRFPGNGTFKKQNTNGQSGSHQNKRFHGNGNQNKKKKQKIDKRELPENNKFSCDICERGFKTEEKYKEHTDGHTKCTYEDCSYVAAPKLVQLHIRMQHYSGLAKKIWSLDSKEDIEKWRAERKRNFPTAENVAKKRALSAEKKARGEVLETKQFGKMKGQNRNKGQQFSGDSQQKHRHNKRKRRGQRSGDDNGDDTKKARVDTDVNEVKISTHTEMDTEKPENVPQATGDPLSVLLTDSESDCDKVEITPAANPTGDQTDEETGLQGGLGMILASYGADTDPVSVDVKEDVLEETCDKNKSDKPSPKRSKKKGNNSQKNSPQTNLSKAGKNKWKNNKLFNNTKSSLLEKLLAKEIRHERNVILQCVYYIVKNNFFGARQSTSSRSVRDNSKGGLIDDDVCM